MRYEEVLYGLLSPTRTPEQARDDAMFWRYHDDNPWVLDELVRLMKEDLAAGIPHTGVKLYVEVLRFYDRRRTKTNDFKLNAKNTSRYARLIAHRHPELRPYFETRAGESVSGFDPIRGGGG